MEPLRGAQLLPIAIVFIFPAHALPEISALPWAAVVCIAAALLYVAFERRIDPSRGRLASLCFALFFVTPLVLDLNARWSPPPTLLRADVTATCCTCNRPSVTWHNLERGYAGYRGAFHISFVRPVR